MNHKEKPWSPDRRNFLKATATGAGILALNGIAPYLAEARIRPAKWAAETDVVVLGGGGGGLFAAIEAAAAGAKVILLESMPTVGGSSAICGGDIVFAGTDLQKEKGIEDSNKLLYSDFMKAGKNRNIPEMVQNYVDNQLETYEHLKKLGVTYKAVVQGEGSVPRSHRTNPAELIAILKKEADRLGVRTRVESPATRLITNAEGRVVGVLANQGGKEIAVGARRGVVVATGGFSNNPELLDELKVGFSKVRSMAAPGCRGDGFIMLAKLGAHMRDLPSLKASFSQHPKSKPGKRQPVNTYRVGSIIINKQGKRFVNEGLGHKDLPEFVLKQPDGISYEVFDSKIAPQAATKSMMIKEEELEQWGIKANSLDELAAKAGVPADALKDTVARYNQYVDAGKDPDFGRDGLIGHVGKLIRIDTPPFYLIEGICAILGTYCGAQVNSKAQVLDVYGQTIPGLYAAGEVLGGLHGDGYIGGTAFGKALIFGRLAGKNAAAATARKK
jgi:fumarate reductase flavoprotein subunit